MKAYLTAKNAEKEGIAESAEKIELPEIVFNRKERGERKAQRMQRKLNCLKSYLTAKNAEKEGIAENAEKIELPEIVPNRKERRLKQL